MSSTLYLESYVESTAALPAELQRILTTIKTLDERAQDLLDTLKRNTEAIVALPPQGSRKAKEDQELRELQRHIQNDEKMLLQFVEEKVQLAWQAQDLINMHQTQLDETLELFEGEMAANNMNVAAEYNPFEYGMTAAKGGRSGKGYDVFDSLEPLAAPSLRKISAPSVAATAAATAVGGVHKTKRVRDDGGGRGGSAAATAAVLAQGDDYGMGGKCCRQLHAVVPACLVIAQYGGYDVAL
eukprot:jgi/Chrzof1/1989/Cz10g28300.t1